MNVAVAALPTTAAGSVESVFTFKAPLLDRILDNPEDPEQRAVALDLGAASQNLVDRLAASRPCRIEIADLIRNGGLSQITNLAAIEDLATRSAALKTLLPPSNDEPLDIIFCWDLPNYLSLTDFKLLTDLLAERAAPGCILHTLIAYSKRDMPDQPGRYLTGKDGQLTQILASDETRSAPRYSPEDLGNAVGGFKYQKGVLLANGMQEFVYAWPEKPGVKRSLRAPKAS